MHRAAYIPPGPWSQDTFYNKDPQIGALFPEYGIEHVLICTPRLAFPLVLRVCSS